MSLKKKKKLTWYIAIWSNPRDSKESALIDYYQLSKLIFPVPPSPPPPHENSRNVATYFKH